MRRRNATRRAGGSTRRGGSGRRSARRRAPILPAVDVEAAQLFFSLLALVALGGAVVARRRPAAGRPLAPRAAQLVAAVDDAALWIAFLVAATATAGSLYFSEVADFVPCQLCWFQRIAMYPLAVILLVAAIRRDRGVRWYVGPLAAIGAVDLDVPLPRRVAPVAGGRGVRRRPVVRRHLVPRARLRDAGVHGAVRLRRHPRPRRPPPPRPSGVPVTTRSRTPLVLAIVLAVVAVVAIAAVVLTRRRR